MKLKTLLLLIKVLALSLIGVSCDGVTVFDSCVSWRLVNESGEELKMRTQESWDCSFSDTILSDSGEFVFCVFGEKHKDERLFKNPSSEYESISIETIDGIFVLDEKVLFESDRWTLIKKNGDLVPFQRSVFTEYDTWYDYTFTITDEMLEAARKGGGE